MHMLKSTASACEEVIEHNSVKTQSHHIRCCELHHDQICSPNLVMVKNNTIIYVARASNSKRDCDA